MRALLVAALALAGCAQPMHGPEYGLVGVILRISYDAVFQPDDVATAAARLGWRTENGTSPAGFGAVVVESPELTLRAYRAHSGDAVWERGWWLEATFRLPEPLPATSDEDGMAQARARAPEYEPMFLRAVAPLEAEGGFRRANLTASCLCTVTVE